MVSSLLLAALLAAFLYGVVPPWLLALLCVGLFLIAAALRRNHSHSAWMQLDLLAQRSALSHWNPGLKVCGCMALLVLSVGADSFLVAIVLAVVMTGVNLNISPISPGSYASLLAAPVTFLALSGLVLLLEVGPQPLGYLDIPFFSGYLRATPASRTAAALVISKALGALCCLYTLGLSTTMYEITGFLRRIKVPAVMVELMILIYRYIFVLMESLHTMTTAAHARLGYRNYRSSWRSFGGIGANLLARAFARASRSFDAMEARGYQGEIRFLEQQKPVCRQHVAITATLPVLLLLLWMGEKAIW